MYIIIIIIIIIIILLLIIISIMQIMSDLPVAPWQFLTWVESVFDAHQEPAQKMTNKQNAHILHAVFSL